MHSGGGFTARSAHPKQSVPTRSPTADVRQPGSCQPWRDWIAPADPKEGVTDGADSTRDRIGCS
jgi:hypothetical protein